MNDDAEVHILDTNYMIVHKRHASIVRSMGKYAARSANCLIFQLIPYPTPSTVQFSLIFQFPGENSLENIFPGILKH